MNSVVFQLHLAKAVKKYRIIFISNELFPIFIPRVLRVNAVNKHRQSRVKLYFKGLQVTNSGCRMMSFSGTYGLRQARDEQLVNLWQCILEPVHTEQCFGKSIIFLMFLFSCFLFPSLSPFYNLSIIDSLSICVVLNYFRVMLSVGLM